MFKGQFHTTLLLCLLNVLLWGQPDSAWYQKPTLEISGFADVFYIYDFNQPKGTKRQEFLFNHNRHNEFNLNLGFVKFSLDQLKYRADIALQTGTYANDNYAAEPGVLKNIFEAHVGVALNKKNNLWLDAGVLPSHIGFESAVSPDNQTMTRSILAENSPYYMAGVKLSFKPHDDLEIAGLILNGWQRIQRLEGNALPSFGTQVQYSHAENITLNWSTFLGTDDPDPIRRMRYYNDFYGLFQITKSLGITACFDIGIQERNKNSSVYDYWLSPVLVGQLALNDNWKTAIRAEYYLDKTGIIIPTNTAHGFKTAGLSLNVDYAPIPNLVCRMEARWLSSQDDIFEARITPTNNNFIIGTSLAVSFSEAMRLEAGAKGR